MLADFREFVKFTFVDHKPCVMDYVLLGIVTPIFVLLAGPIMLPCYYIGKLIVYLLTSKKE